MFANTSLPPSSLVSLPSPLMVRRVAAVLARPYPIWPAPPNVRLRLLEPVSKSRSESISRGALVPASWFLMLASPVRVMAPSHELPPVKPCFASAPRRKRPGAVESGLDQAPGPARLRGLFTLAPLNPRAPKFLPPRIRLPYFSTMTPPAASVVEPRESLLRIFRRAPLRSASRVEESPVQPLTVVVPL